MSSLEQVRRELERQREGDPLMMICPSHPEQEAFAGQICPSCYRDQQVRVESESTPLRYANTSEALRAKVLASLAERNGH